MKRPQMAGQCCGNCRWLRVEEGHVTDHDPPTWRDSIGLSCDWPMPPSIPLPISITKAYGFATEVRLNRSWMYPTDTGCPAWEPMEQCPNPKESA